MKILVMKFRNIGDVLLTTPLLENLKHYYPDAKIHFALNKGCEAMIEGNPNVDKIHIYDRNEVKKATIFKRIYLEYKFAKTLKNEKFDIIIQTTKGDRGLIIAKFCGVKTVVSYLAKNRIFNKFITHKIKEQGSAHTVLANLDALKALGYEPKNARVKIYFDDYSQDSKFKNIPNKFIHIHPMSRWIFKCIDDETLAKIIDFCELNLNQKVVLTCDKNRVELEKMQNILKNCSTKPVLFLGNLSLKEVAFLSSKSELFIGVDTAIMHIAAANNVPCIAFFGPSGAFHWGPWDNSCIKSGYTQKNGIQTMGKHKVIQKNLDCVPCGKDGCNGSKRSDCLINLDLNLIKNSISQFFKAE
ncbi:putative lipopolysaccharide heptosyltransferase III [Campylobacter fetus subsp. testudinum]|uniref:putative lipopolysaccharide heptosyltransferase III n=1 Tax=Campylobacter fetus TaxID=196 RepID=UPI0008189CF6|nr:putative lipopolysaccharide heptosyltransferase III [Campylobacter fetus]OCS01025.1 putative lipopolysaccharide heptosyltransferase III [Campylobacter fetus subsp. testudinum]